MARRRLNKLSPPARMHGYGRALHVLAQGSAAVVEPHLPDGAEDLGLLAALCDEVSASDVLWLTLGSANDVARARRKRLAGAARGQYEKLRAYMHLAARKLKDRSLIAAFLKGTPAPSALKAAELPSAMEHLRRGVAAHPEWFPRLSADAARLAAFDASREDLIGALAASSSAALAHTRASAQRKQSRADLLDQIRIVEGGLKTAFTAEEYAQIARLRALHLPLIASAEAEEEDDDIDIDDEVVDG